MTGTCKIHVAAEAQGVRYGAFCTAPDKHFGANRRKCTKHFPEAVAPPTDHETVFSALALPPYDDTNRYVFLTNHDKFSNPRRSMERSTSVLALCVDEYLGFVQRRVVCSRYAI